MIEQKFLNSSHYQLQQIADGVYASIASSTSGSAVGNSGVIDLGENLLVFDSFLTQDAARDFKKNIEETLHKPIRYVVNSHYHSDHIRGNQVFASTANIISTTRCRKLIASKGLEEIEWDKANSKAEIRNLTDQHQLETNPKKKQELNYWISFFQHIHNSLPSLRLTLPDLLFEEKLTLTGQNQSVEIISTNSGHTESDSVLYIPDKKILFTGDLVFVEHHPYLVNSPTTTLIKTLQDLMNLEIDILIPGHGPISNVSGIDKMIQYITDLKVIAGEAKDKTSEQRNELLNHIPPPYDSWHFSNRFFPMNLRLFRKIWTITEQVTGKK